MIYFDSSATTFQKPNTVYAAVAEAMRTMASPGRGGYRQAAAAADTVFRCRQLAASMFECETEQVVFTFNATHGLNIAIKTLVAPGARVVVSGFEHNAVMRPLHKLQAQIVTAGRRLFDPDDTLAAFRDAVTPDTAAVICTQVSNVFGYRLPIEQIAALCRQRKVPLVIDAAQAAGVVPVSLKKTGAAFIAMPGHKALYGPQGTGILLCGRLPQTLLEGGTGSQSALQQMPDWLPDRVEAGTANVPGICGLLAGMEYVLARGMAQIAAHEAQLSRRLQRQLAQIRDIRVFQGAAQTGVTSFQTAMTDCEEVAQALAQRDIAVRAGLHCAPLAHESAGTLQTGTVRVSFSCFNTEAEVDRFVTALSQILHG